MRVVLDTNVIVSGLLTPHGPCGQIIELLLKGVLRACVDGRIVDEYDRILYRHRFHIPQAQASVILNEINASAESIAAVPLPELLPDPDDAAFLEVAAAADAVLVTGNARHFPSRARAGVAVVSPKEFLDLLRSAP